MSNPMPLILSQLENDFSAPEIHREVNFQALSTGSDVAVAILMAIGIAAMVWSTYRRERLRHPLPAWQRRLLTGLRMLCVLTVLVMLCEPVLVTTEVRHEPAHVVVLVDASQSMTQTDVAERPASPSDPTAEGRPAVRSVSRFDAAVRWTHQVAAPWRKDHAVTTYFFSDSLQSWNATAPPDANLAKGKFTAIGDALEAAWSEHRSNPLAGFVVVSDGRNNFGLPPERIARQLGQSGIPVHAVMLGGVAPLSGLAIQELDCDKTVFARDPVTVSVSVAARGLQGKAVDLVMEVRRAEEETRGPPDASQVPPRADAEAAEWQPWDQRTVILDAPDMRIAESFTWTPPAPGEWVLRARITGAGSSSTVPATQAVRGVRVIDHSVRVFLLAGYPAPEIQFLQNTLRRDPALKFSCWLQTAPDGSQPLGSIALDRLPQTSESLEQYDCVLLFDPDLTQLDPEWSKLLADFVGQRAGGLGYIAGEWNTAALFRDSASRPDTAWNGLLPVVVDQLPASIEMELQAQELWNIELTEQGLAHPLFEFETEATDNRALLDSLPGMYWYFPVTRAKAAATVLARHADPRRRNELGQHVLFAIQRYGAGHAAFLGFDSTYRWRYLNEGLFDGFWLRLIDQLGRTKALGGNLPFRLATEKSNYEVGERVRVELRGRETLVPVTEQSNPVGQLVANGQTVLRFNFVPGADGTPPWFEWNVKQPGTYSLRASFPGSELFRNTTGLPVDDGGSIETEFTVVPADRELADPSADPGVMRSLARHSGGTSRPWQDRAKLLDAFRPQPVTNHVERRRELWSSPYMFGLVPLLLTLEWTLRQRWRMA